VNEIAAKAPDAIMAVPLGAQCPTFLSEVAKAEAANAGWDPQIYLTNTCSSALILGAAGDAANGIYTSSNLKDVNDPAVQQEPAVAEYIAYMTANGYADIVTTGAAGWGTAETTVAILAQAAASPEGLTRASIINAARNFVFTGSLARDGIVSKMDGEADPYLNESLQVIQYDSTAKTFTDIGELITEFES
jgi:hypothetical protein